MVDICTASLSKLPITIDQLTLRQINQIKHSQILMR